MKLSLLFAVVCSVYCGFLYGAGRPFYNQGMRSWYTSYVSMVLLKDTGVFACPHQEIMCFACWCMISNPLFASDNLNYRPNVYWKSKPNSFFKERTY